MMQPTPLSTKKMEGLSQLEKYKAPLTLSMKPIDNGVREKPSERSEMALTSAKSESEMETQLSEMKLNVRPKKKTLTQEELQAKVITEKKESVTR